LFRVELADDAGRDEITEQGDEGVQDIIDGTFMPYASLFMKADIRRLNPSIALNMVYGLPVLGVSVSTIS
jgi:hypothetical protein